MGMIDFIRALMGRKVCTVGEYRAAVEAAADEVDADGDQLVSVRELISATWRILDAYLREHDR